LAQERDQRQNLVNIIFNARSVGFAAMLMKIQFLLPDSHFTIYLTVNKEKLNRKKGNPALKDQLVTVV